MFRLYGTRGDIEYASIGESGEWVETKDFLATFDTMDLAYDYASASELKAAKSQYFYPEVRRGKYRYRKGSLLRNYDDFEVTVHPDPVLPHNPVFGEND